MYCTDNQASFFPFATRIGLSAAGLELVIINHGNGAWYVFVHIKLAVAQNTRKLGSTPSNAHADMVPCVLLMFRLT
jgi:hypothetical protein